VTEQKRLIVIGSNNAGFDLAGRAADAGLGDVTVLEVTDRTPPPRAATRHRVKVHHHTRVRSVRSETDRVVVDTDAGELTATAVAIAAVPQRGIIPPGVSAALAGRVHGALDEWAESGLDVLVVADGEAGAQAAIDLVATGCSVVAAFQPGSLKHMSETSRLVLSEYEVERRITMLWRSEVESVQEVGGYPMVYFRDRQTPDLQFDHVVFAVDGAHGDDTLGFSIISDGSATESRVAILVDDLEADHRFDDYALVTRVQVAEAWNAIRDMHFPDLPKADLKPAVWVAGQDIGQLRDQHYNATITHFDPHHSDLWVLRVRPDHGDVSHLAGQYTTLGLGYWEPRIDPAVETLDDNRRRSLIRRSYSISSPIFDENGYLVDPHERDELEFYIVRVPPTASRIPALTPRLALKHPDDRIFLGPRMAGRYTLHAVNDPSAAVVFLSSGTGEAPHNAMIGKLLSRGHHGPIVSVVSVRYASDLGYAVAHRRLEERFANYTYLPLVTRDPDQPKRYVQDAISDGTIAALTNGLDPESSHIYMCGNPAMLGIPTWDEDTPEFPVTVGAARLLHERGFTLDRRGTVGNVHFEAYW
jgi:ferredoxin--NADP+ reductase